MHADRLRWMTALSMIIAACSGGEQAETPRDTSLAYADDPTVRSPFRAGKDYPGDPVAIDERVGELLAAVGEVEPRRAFAIVTPHAGFAYSGHVAAAAYARVRMPDTVVLVTPKHHGEGESPAFWNDGPFIIPGHALEIRDDLVERFLELAPDDAVVDRAAFVESQNHPLENQLPFITTMNTRAKIVPFTIYDNSQRDFTGWDLERVSAWGLALAELVRELEANGEDVLVVASTDLVHRIPRAEAEVQDATLMAHIVDLDVPGLYDYVVDEGITICGEIPVAVTMAAAIELGYTRTELVELDNSFHRQQDPESVVGYGSAIFWPEDT